MTDRYLVRGKRRDNGEWAVGYGYAVESQSDIAFIHIAPTTHHSRPICMVDPTTLGQCTGTIDKTGRLVFDGDILWDDALEIMAYIYWNVDHLSYMINFIKNGCMKFSGEITLRDLIPWSVVIGNIHDNPELLTKEDVAHE